MKPREFWIKDHGGPTFDVEVLYTPISNSIHVREVVPIDWDQIWFGILKWTATIDKLECAKQMQDKIQQLVEKQLAGEE